MTPVDDNDDLGDLPMGELRRLARSRPSSGRAAMAKASAIRTSVRLERQKDGIPPMPSADWYPPDMGEEWRRLDEPRLEAHPEVRQRMWENWWRSRRGR